MLIGFNREHLAIDVDMCSVVLDLRDRERRLAAKSRDIKVNNSRPCIPLTGRR